MNVVDGLALYLRALSREQHGTPKQLAARLKRCGLSWAAIGVIWQFEGGKTRILNKTETVQRYADALREVGIRPFVWGYPWQGREEEFAKAMQAADPSINDALLDPELGANPSRSTKAAAMKKAEIHASTLVRRMREEGFTTCGFSTYGTVKNIRFFPFGAYLDALVTYFPGACFAGGQTYTDDSKIDMSMKDFLDAIERAGHRASIEDGDIQLVPNFGLYSWKKVGGKRKARAKTPEELASHLFEFVDDDEPVDALIGWAENFLTVAQEPELARFARVLERGACALPSRE